MGKAIRRAALEDVLPGENPRRDFADGFEPTEDEAEFVQALADELARIDAGDGDGAE